MSKYVVVNFRLTLRLIVLWVDEELGRQGVGAPPGARLALGPHLALRHVQPRPNLGTVTPKKHHSGRYCWQDGLE